MHPATEQKYEHQQCQETSATVYNSKEIIHIQISFKNLQLYYWQLKKHISNTTWPWHYKIGYMR